LARLANSFHEIEDANPKQQEAKYQTGDLAGPVGAVTLRTPAHDGQDGTEHDQATQRETDRPGSDVSHHEPSLERPAALHRTETTQQKEQGIRILSDLGVESPLLSQDLSTLRLFCAAPLHDHTVQDTRTIPKPGGKRPFDNIFPWILFTTLAGLPATVAPVGQTKDGLPVGIQVIGPNLEDATSLDVAGQVADAAGGFKPPIRPSPALMASCRNA